MTRFDAYLGGPFEMYGRDLYTYKSEIKRAFPLGQFFDPETHPSQQDGTWFQANYEAMLSSKAMIAKACPLPFSGVSQEAGMFYVMHNNGNFYRPLNNLIIIWNKNLDPKYGQEVASRVGYIVENVEEAIERLRPIITS